MWILLTPLHSWEGVQGTGTVLAVTPEGSGEQEAAMGQLRKPTIQNCPLVVKKRGNAVVWSRDSTFQNV